jgi:hypothetical protein
LALFQFDKIGTIEFALQNSVLIFSIIKKVQNLLINCAGWLEAEGTKPIARQQIRRRFRLNNQKYDLICCTLGMQLWELGSTIHRKIRYKTIPRISQNKSKIWFGLVKMPKNILAISNG